VVWSRSWQTTPPHNNAFPSYGASPVSDGSVQTRSRRNARSYINKLYRERLPARASYLAAMPAAQAHPGVHPMQIILQAIPSQICPSRLAPQQRAILISKCLSKILWRILDLYATNTINGPLPALITGGRPPKYKS